MVTGWPAAANRRNHRRRDSPWAMGHPGRQVDGDLDDFQPDLVLGGAA
jgi:hypothetical protein